jgi:mannose-1-phosphate guanylyltransferase / mannose-6-phosphate isomerase
MKVIILAGGNGTRLWPLSRERYPKQFVKLQNKKESLFQETFKRGLELTDMDDILIVTHQQYKFLVMGEIEELGYNYNEDRIILEPESKNTLPAVYAGTREILNTRSEIVVVLPSDHMIESGEVFIQAIKASEALAKSHIVAFGSSLGKGAMGIFMFDAQLFVQEVEKHAREIYHAFNTSECVDEAFLKINAGISMLDSIVKYSDKVKLAPIDITWNDLSSFDDIYKAFEKDDFNNIIDSNHIVIDSSNNLVYSEHGKLVAAIGIEDLIVVDNRDALLICKKDSSQKVKEVVDILKTRQDPRKDYHVEDYRPWGYYKILEEEKNAFKIKRITVYQGKKLSYQLHHHRSEHWIVVKGMAKVTIDDEIYFVSAGESIFMKAGQKHRLENPGKTSLEIIEVQMGGYLEEDDIVRFDDDYGRKK